MILSMSLTLSLLLLSLIGLASLISAQTTTNVSAVTLTSNGPFMARQQGGLYAITNNGANSATVVNGSTTASISSLIIFGGENPVTTGLANDVYYVDATLNYGANSYKQVSVGAFNSESYGVATCSDPNKQILYSVGGDLSNDQNGTNLISYSFDLGKTWQTTNGLWTGRSNCLCYVDSQSRLYVIGGKWASSTGTAVSNDVWTATVTSTGSSSISMSWSRSTSAAPFSARDGGSGATYYSSFLQSDILYVSGGYIYDSYNAQLSTNDNGVGTNDVWYSTNQGVQWTFLTNAAFGPRYHSKFLATRDGVLIMLGGAGVAEPTNNGTSQTPSYLINDMWASLDGGNTWGLCASQLFPLSDSTIDPSQYARGTGREDPFANIDPATGYIYFGGGLQRDSSGNKLGPRDLFRSSISFYNISQVARRCGRLTIPSLGTGLQLSSVTQTCGFYSTSPSASYDFSSLSTYDISGTDGTAGSNLDSYYLFRLCGAVADPECGGAMVCQKQFPNYDAGVANSSTTCGSNVQQLASRSNALQWSFVSNNVVDNGIKMTIYSDILCGSSVYTTNIVFMCAPLQTRPLNFASAIFSSSQCQLNLTLFTSIACSSAQLAAAPTAIAAPPAASSSNCGYGGVSFASLAVDMTATDEAGRKYYVHPCGAVSASLTQYCSYPNNAQQYPQLYPSACEVTGYCNPFYAIDSFGYFNPSASDFVWYPLSNGFAYSQRTSLSQEGWTSANCGSSTGQSTFEFVCQPSATTAALTSSMARVYADPRHCQYIVVLPTSLACSGSSNYLPSPSSSVVTGMGYDFTPLTGYDIFAAETGVYYGAKFVQFSFCLTIFNGTSGWSYSGRGVVSASYTSYTGSLSSPGGTFTINSLISGVMSSSQSGVADAALTISPFGSDSSDNNLILTAGSTTATTTNGGVTFNWTESSGATRVANAYSGQVDSGYDGVYWAPSARFTLTAQYYDSSVSTSLITCNNAATPIAADPATASQQQLPAYFYYINLGGSVSDPTCQANAPGSMVCQRDTANNCSRTAAAAYWAPSTLLPAWSWINGANYSSGVQLSLLSNSSSVVHTGSSQLTCVGSLVKIMFVCDKTAVHPYAAQIPSTSVSANFACVFAFTIATYVVCAAPSTAVVVAPSNTVSCGATVGGRTYDLSSLTVYDYSATASSGQLYVTRPCGSVAAPFCQASSVTYTSQMCSYPSTFCSLSGNSITTLSLAGAYSASSVTWSSLSNGIQMSQATGSSCTATCNGQTLYSGAKQSNINYICSTNSSSSVIEGSYDSSCQPINGGSCSVTFVIYTSAACSSTQASSSSSSSSLSGGAIAGIVIGVIVGVLLLCVVLFLCLRASRSSKSFKGEAGSHQLEEHSHVGEHSQVEHSQIQAHSEIELEESSGV